MPWPGTSGPHPSVVLTGVVTVRWCVVGLLAAVALATWAMGPTTAQGHWLRWSSADVRPVLATLLVWTAINIGTRLWLVSHDRLSATWVGAQLVLDTVMLALCTAAWGGTGNPFVALFVVPVVLATSLGGRWTTIVLGAVAVSCAAVAVLVAAPASGAVVVAVVGCAVIASWIVQQTSRSVIREREELTRQRDENIADAHLAALGTLAAGAAHELGTPLGTVNLLAAELPHMEPDEQKSALDTIKREVERCKDILHRMASPEVRVSALSARDAQPWFLCELQDELDDPEGVKLAFVATAATREMAGTTTLARASLGQILRELVANGAEACRRKPGNRGVTVRVDVVGEDGLIEVDDDGVGMEPHVASMVFDPFFTTKPEGQGMGLGLYLARAQLRQLGGNLDLQSSPGRGTKVTIRVALRPVDAYPR
jgi:two-component system sensor histidine kinase RegB